MAMPLIYNHSMSLTFGLNLFSRQANPNKNLLGNVESLLSGDAQPLQTNISL